MQSVVGSGALDIYHRTHGSHQDEVQAPLVRLGMDLIAKELLLSKLTSLIESIVDEICTEKKDERVVIHSKLLSTTNCFVQIAAFSAHSSPLPHAHFSAFLQLHRNQR